MKLLKVDIIEELKIIKEYADLKLGEKILKCIEENGKCSLEAEL